MRRATSFFAGQKTGHAETSLKETQKRRALTRKTLFVGEEDHEYPAIIIIPFEEFEKCTFSYSTSLSILCFGADEKMRLITP